jgi:hypothetical protein
MGNELDNEVLSLEIDDTVDGFFQTYIEGRELSTIDQAKEQYRELTQLFEKCIDEDNLWMRLKYSHMLLHKAAYITQLLMKKRN